MNWKQIGINLLIVALVYSFFYVTSFLASKKFASKKKESDKNEKQK